MRQFHYRPELIKISPTDFGRSIPVTTAQAQAQLVAVRAAGASSKITVNHNATVVRAGQAK